MQTVPRARLAPTSGCPYQGFPARWAKLTPRPTPLEEQGAKDIRVLPRSARLHMSLLVPPGAWHPPGHGAWHGRVGAGPGGSEGRREEGAERGSGSGRGLRREMSSRRPGWAGWGPAWASSRRQGPRSPFQRAVRGGRQVKPDPQKTIPRPHSGIAGGAPSRPHLNPKVLPWSRGG